jgi:hypothetical protein
LNFSSKIQEISETSQGGNQGKSYKPQMDQGKEVTHPPYNSPPIFDFSPRGRFWILDWAANPKSAIQNPKWVGAVWWLRENSPAAPQL